MATKYVVLQATDDNYGDDHPALFYVGEVDGAANAQTACRKVADAMSDSELADGVTLIAVPARNWTSGRNTFRAETRRRLLRS